MKREHLKLLEASFDRELTSDENKRLQMALDSDPDLRDESEKLSKLRELVKEGALTFNPYFATRVMNRIDKLKENSLEFAFWRIAVPGLAAAAIIVLVTLFTGHSLSLDTLMGVNTLQPEYLSDFLIYGQ